MTLLHQNQKNDKNMVKETKTFFQKYWQAILIAVSMNIIVGIITNVGAYQVVLYKLEENIKQDEVQGQSIFELQLNQMTIANEENIKLPCKYTNAREGSNN